MVIKGLAVDAAAVGDLTNGDLVQGLFLQKICQGFFDELPGADGAAVFCFCLGFLLSGQNRTKGEYVYKIDNSGSFCFLCFQVSFIIMLSNAKINTCLIL